MDDEFFKSANFSREQLHSLMPRSSGLGLARLILQWTLILLAAVIMVWQFGHNGWLWSAALVVVSFGICPLFALSHETIHRSAFQERWLNDVISFLSSASIFYVPEWFRHFHFAHHRYTHDPTLDPELAPILGRTAPVFTASLPMYLSFLSGMALFLFKAFMMLLMATPMPRSAMEKLLPYVKPAKISLIQWQSRLCILVFVGLGVAGTLWWPGIWSLLIAQLIGHGILAVYVAAEHGGLPHEGSMLERTRTIQTNAFVRFLMWNMPYHAEHHAYPAVPWHALPELHKLIEKDLIHTVPGYTDLHLRIIGQLAKGKPFLDYPEHKEGTSKDV